MITLLILALVSLILTIVTGELYSRRVLKGGDPNDMKLVSDIFFLATIFLLLAVLIIL